VKFISTRGKQTPLSIGEAMMQGLATDGGLFVPDHLPRFDYTTFMSLESISSIAHQFLTPFFNGDVLQSKLKDICDNTFNFPIPLNFYKSDTAVLELFHGPTGAFKDVGAKFLAQCLHQLGKTNTVLVATSGDTGSAVASAFDGLSSINVVILYPKGMVSEFQEKQLTCWGNNILSLRVNGDFDICQKLVKDAFADPGMSKKFKLTSANSINIGRLLPQCVYYISSSLEYYRTTKRKASYIIPTGNMGNAMAAIWAREMGFPIREIILSCNENDTIVEFFEKGKFIPKPSIKTLANAMDVGNPSNMERYLHLEATTTEQITYITAYSVSDDSIRNTIQRSKDEWAEIWCPHTATAVYIREMIDKPDWILVSTAHPSKFKDIVEPIIQTVVEYPPHLVNFLSQEPRYQDIESQLKEVREAMESYFRK
jgi:threonine synthase